MINERSFASSFPDFWQELLPFLTPSCVHLLNIGHEKHLKNEKGLKLDSVEISEEARNSVIVSEFAYYLAKEAFNNALSVNEAFKDDFIRNIAQVTTIEFVNRYESGFILADSNLNDAELSEGLQLANRYETFAHLQGGTERCVFQIPIKGCGFLHNCYADLAIGDYLIEVKTVTRSLAGKDIRQLIIYLALSSVAHPGLWQYAGFFNPRRATFHRFRINELIDLVSGGKTAVEVYTELLDFTCSTDVQLDTKF